MGMFDNWNLGLNEKFTEGAQKGLRAPLSQLDPETIALRDQQKNRANRLTDTSLGIDEALQDTDKSGDLSRGQDVLNQGYQALGGDQSTLARALGERSRRDYGMTSSALNESAKQAAPMKAFQAQGQVMNSDAADFQIRSHQAEMAQQSYEAMRAARAQVMNSVFQILGVGIANNFASSMLGGKQQPQSLGAASEGQGAAAGESTAYAGGAETIGSAGGGTLANKGIMEAAI